MMLPLVFLTLSSLLAVDAAPARRSDALPEAAPRFEYPGDAPWSYDAADYASSLTCPKGYPTAFDPPVLLVHGTYCVGNQTWDSGYVPALEKAGYKPCYISIPDRALGDMQTNSEFVAYNLHYLSHLSGGIKTAVISHSQGGPDVQWALQFWPSTQHVTSAFVALSPDLHGITDYKCSSLIDCVPALWQQEAGSNFYKALHNSHFHAQVPTTTIWSSDDGTVYPYEQNAQLNGGTAVEVQSLCPGRSVAHIPMLTDSAGFAIAQDALQHHGYASLSRLIPHNSTICGSTHAPGMEVTFSSQVSLIAGITAATTEGNKTKSEPPTKAYAKGFF